MSVENRDPRSLAEELVRITLGEEVVLPDDLPLRERVFKMGNRRVGAEYVSEIRSLLEKAPHVSSFFRDILVYQAEHTVVNGWISKREALESAWRFCGVHVEAGEWGIFDPDPIKVLEFETAFLGKFLPALRFRERNGEKNPVNWRDWMADIVRRQPNKP